MIEQGTAEWKAQRCGKITASRFSDVMSFLKNGKPSESRQKYMREIVFEILSGVPKQCAQGQALKWGSEIEQFAREAYELKTGSFVYPSEFITHPTIDFIGCSPDGLVGEEGGIEIKCPYDEGKHIQTLLEGVPQEHIPQIQGNLFVTNRKWWDFVSFDPRQAEGHRMYVERVLRDEDYISNLSKEICIFYKEVQEMIDVLKCKKGIL